MTNTQSLRTPVTRREAKQARMDYLMTTRPINLELLPYIISRPQCLRSDFKQLQEALKKAARVSPLLKKNLSQKILKGMLDQISETLEDPDKKKNMIAVNQLVSNLLENLKTPKQKYPDKYSQELEDWPHDYATYMNPTPRSSTSTSSSSNQ